MKGGGGGGGRDVVTFLEWSVLQSSLDVRVPAERSDSHLPLHQPQDLDPPITKFLSLQVFCCFSPFFLPFSHLKVQWI